MPKHVVIATMKTAPGTRSYVAEALRRHAVRCAQSESGTLVFDVLVDNEDADTLMLYEVYENLDAFNAHLKGESIEKLRSETEGRIVDLKGRTATLA